MNGAQTVWNCFVFLNITADTDIWRLFPKIGRGTAAALSRQHQQGGERGTHAAEQAGKTSVPHAHHCMRPWSGLNAGYKVTDKVFFLHEKKIID